MTQFAFDGVEIPCTIRDFLLDLDDNALPFFGINENGSRFGFTPGGGAEASATPKSTELRKLHEETGPSHVTVEVVTWRLTQQNKIEARLHNAQERWFLDLVPRFDPDVSSFDELERSTMPYTVGSPSQSSVSARID